MGSHNGTNGTSIPATSVAELHDRVAQYRTALVALMAMVKRETSYLSPADQQLLRQVRHLLDEE